jgi:hypothetical protein
MAAITDEIRVTILHTKKGGRPLVRVEDSIYFEGIVVPAGLVSDFASTPWGTWNVFPPYGPYAAASFVHDYLYQTKGLWGQYTRAEADKVFLRAMKKLNVPAWKRHAMYAAVRAGGWSGWGK